MSLFAEPAGFFAVALSCAVAVAGIFASTPARAWDRHGTLTNYALFAVDNWESVVPEPIEAVLPKITVEPGLPPAVSLAEFVSQMKIRGDFVKWDWAPAKTSDGHASARDVLMYAVDEPDGGMDQNLNVTPDQKYMGGFSGLSSQGFRHMYFGSFRLNSPLATFHVPFHALGHAPELIERMFNLAKQAQLSGHSFWAYRFLGWGLHYLEDVSQPYHSSQIPSLALWPFATLLKGWDAFVLEATRFVANFHLAFERYTEFLLDPARSSRRPNEELMNAFRVPRATPELKRQLEQNMELTIRSGAIMVSAASADLAGGLAKSQHKLFGGALHDKALDLRSADAAGKDAAGKLLIDYAAIETNPELAEHRKELRAVTVEALSNMGVATRWYLDRFRAATLPQ